MFSIDFIAATNKYTDYAFETHVPAPYFRKNFIVDKVPAKAEITICGLGFYRLFINGTEMTKGHLAPYGWFFTEVVIPDSCKGKRVVFKAALGESIVWVNGRLMGALDKEHDMITLTRCAVPGEKYHSIYPDAPRDGNRYLL